MRKHFAHLLHLADGEIAFSRNSAKTAVPLVPRSPAPIKPAESLESVGDQDLRKGDRGDQNHKLIVGMGGQGDQRPNQHGFSGPPLKPAETLEFSSEGTKGTRGTNVFDISAQNASSASAVPDFDEVDELEMFAADAPQEWVEGVRKLRTMPMPEGVTPREWAALVAVAAPLVAGWGKELHEAGWSTLEVFGVCALAPIARLDQAGLARFLVEGEQVVEVTAKRIALLSKEGMKQGFYKTVAPGGVALWELK